MKPQKFQPGQAVTPIRLESFVAIEGLLVFGPKPGKIYHVRDYPMAWHNKWTIRLIECPYDDAAFIEDDFAPVISDSHLESDLREITESVPEEFILAAAP